MTQNRKPNIAIIGAGPAGLMAAQTLAKAGYPATVYDAMPSAARKFLQAGRGGLNLTHDDEFDFFVSRYFEAAPNLLPALEKFTPTSMRTWAAHFGFETFVGSSGKVYPLDKKAAPLLRAWLHQLKQQGTTFKMKHLWTDWQSDTSQHQSSEPSLQITCKFSTPQGETSATFDAVILALGGASWPHLGSTGSWVEPLLQKAIQIAPLQAANMGFEVEWSDIFIDKFAGQPLKNVTLSFTDIKGHPHQQLGELIVTQHGVEGSLIYTYSKYLREQLKQQTPFKVMLDLFPHRTHEQLNTQLNGKRGKLSLSAFWKRCGIDGIKASMLRELLSKQQLTQPQIVTNTLKAFPLTLQAPRPIAEAISTAGGVTFESLNEQLMLKNHSGVFCAGEMLDWEAPTGGYLLTAVMAQGQQAAQGVLNYLQTHNKRG
ncbi:MAG: TIGR03862 family flavoprotein [Thiotrichales bacterium]|nr:TIGR03862 family flavoprotein [Thiotrichales bacterium]